MAPFTIRRARRVARLRHRFRQSDKSPLRIRLRALCRSSCRRSSARAWSPAATWQIHPDIQLFAQYVYARSNITLTAAPTPAATFNGDPVLYPADGPFYPTEFAAANGISGPLELFYRTVPLGPSCRQSRYRFARIDNRRGGGRCELGLQHRVHLQQEPPTAVVAERMGLRAALPRYDGDGPRQPLRRIRSRG
jgi:hypothetical protein